MKENIDEIEDFLNIAHDCGIKRVRFMRLKYAKSRNISDRNFEFDYYDQNNKNVRKKFLKLLPLYKKLAERLDIKIEAGTMLSAAINLNTAGEFVNDVTERLLTGAKLFPIKAKKGVCIMPWFGQLMIGQDGNINLCCGTTYSLGNLNDYSLEDIWDSQKMKVIRRSFSKKRYPKVCGYCYARGLSEYPSNAFTNLER
jgi:radical SAM protein with 4Fe4S-binding SPASM domain